MSVGGEEGGKNDSFLAQAKRDFPKSDIMTSRASSPLYLNINRWDIRGKRNWLGGRGVKREGSMRVYNEGEMRMRKDNKEE